MKLCSIKNYIYIYIYIYTKNQINAQSCSKCCCCKNNESQLNNDSEKEKDKDNKNQINDFGGISGLIGKLEKNKVTFNINTSSGLKKIAETVDNYNGEFNFENVKNLKIKLLGVELDPDTIEKYISDFSNNLELNKYKHFFKGKLTKKIFGNNLGGLLFYDFNDSRYYFSFPITLENRESVFCIVNYNYQTDKCLEYGIIADKGIYFKLVVETGDVFFEPEKQKEYEKCFLEGK